MATPETALDPSTSSCCKVLTLFSVLLPTVDMFWTCRAKYAFKRFQLALLCQQGIHKPFVGACSAALIPMHWYSVPMLAMEMQAHSGQISKREAGNRIGGNADAEGLLPCTGQCPLCPKSL